MKVLVAHGSRHGATAEIARAIADELGSSGHVVDLRDAGALDGLAAWDAAIVGGALYASFWPRRVRRFVAGHADELARMPVWLFSSGPLDDSANHTEIPPTRGVARLARAIAARGHRTFGGRLAADARGFIAAAMVRQGHAGDFRDMDAVRGWARAIAAELTALPPPAARPPVPSIRRARRTLAALCTFTGVTALVGGVTLAGWPQGGGWGPFADTTVLRDTPFRDFLGPGLLLALLVAGPALVAAVLCGRRAPLAAPAAAVAGSAITIWIAVQASLLGMLHPLQVLYFVVGVTTLGLAVWMHVARRRAVRARAPRG